MQTAIRTILCATAVMLAAVSCKKSVEPANPAGDGKGTIEIRVNGLMGEYTQVDGTKADIVNTVRVSWKGGETVYVYDGTQCLGTLAASLEGTEDRYAVLSTDDTHTVSTPADGTTKLTLVYSPQLTEAPTVSEGIISISLADQSGEKASFVAYATLDYTGTTITDAVVPFLVATSVIKVNCTGLKANTTIASARLSNVNTVCKLALSASDAPSVSGDVNGTITRTGDPYFAAANVNGEGEAVFQIGVPVLEKASGVRVLSVIQGSDKARDKKFTTSSLNPATSFNTVCQLVGLPAGALSGEFTVSDDNGATKKQIYFSKGNLIASIDENGAPTAWKFAANQFDYLGEGGANKTIGNTSDSGTAGDVDLFGWSTDAISNNWGIHTKTEATKDYTAGAFNDWGKAIDNNGTWRTLTKNEWCYLFAFTTSGVNTDIGSPRYNRFKTGVTVCGKLNCVVLLPDEWNETVITLAKFATIGKYDENGGSNPKWSEMAAAGAVCLPAAGYRDGSSVPGSAVGKAGYYWSSTADGNSDSVYDIGFNDQKTSLSSDKTGRYYGYSVRLITE